MTKREEVEGYKGTSVCQLCKEMKMFIYVTSCGLTGCRDTLLLFVLVSVCLWEEDIQKEGRCEGEGESIRGKERGRREGRERGGRAYEKSRGGRKVIGRKEGRRALRIGRKGRRVQGERREKDTEIKERKWDT